MEPMPPDPESLRLLTLVAESGSLGRAAARMGVSQPAASKRLALLERRLGLTLVDRGNRGSALTVEGRAVCQWAERVLDQMDTLTVTAAALRADNGNDLRVACSMTLAEHFVPGWIGTLQRRSPDVHVGLTVADSEQVATMAMQGIAGLGFVEAATVPSGLVSRTVGTDRLAVVVPPRHPWARRRRALDLEELARTPLIVREPGSGTREALDRILAGAGVGPAEPLLVLDANLAVRGAVLDGAGPAVLSTVTVRDDLAEGRVVEVPVADANLRRDLRAVWPRGRRLTGAAQDLLRIAQGGGREPRGGA